MFRVEISPDAKNIFRQNVTYVYENYGTPFVEKLLDAFESMIQNLENNPLIGTGRMQDIPAKYLAIHIYKHLWGIYQIYEEDNTIKIEYIIDDRQDYGLFVR